jgi:hypothetical protein
MIVSNRGRCQFGFSFGLAPGAAAPRSGAAGTASPAAPQGPGYLVVDGGGRESRQT